MKKVLIALDNDQHAQKIAEAGFALAKSMNAETIILNVIVEPAYNSAPEHNSVMGSGVIGNAEFSSLTVRTGLKKAAQNYLDKIKHHLGAETIQTIVEEGDIAEAILKTAKLLRTDIIVMGSHSHRWLEQILMGSTTEKVLHHTSVPLFIIPTKEHDPKSALYKKYKFHSYKI